MTKLALGTAQFGSAYGISHQGGAPDRATVRAILEQAQTLGIELLDTAPGYGESEAMIGALSPARAHFRLCSKLPALPRDAAGMDAGSFVEQSVKRSLERLRCDKLHALLAHNADDLLGPAGPALWRAMLAQKQAGRVAYLGLSVYSAEQIDACPFTPDLLQIPLNIFDQRLLLSGHIERLLDRGVELHARSVFLQGVLLMQPDALPARLAGLRKPLLRFRERCSTLGMTPLAAALGFVRDLPGISQIVCGVQSASELAQLGQALAQAQTPPDFSDLAMTDASLVNPALWRL